MIIYVDRKTGKLAQARDFHALGEDVIREDYGLEMIKTKAGKPLKAESYAIFRRYIADIDSWEFLAVSSDGKKKRRRLIAEGWELVKKEKQQIPQELNAAE